MVARNHHKNVVAGATRVSSRISLRLKASKATSTAAAGKVTKVTAKTKTKTKAVKPVDDAVVKTTKKAKTTTTTTTKTVAAKAGTKNKKKAPKKDDEEEEDDDDSSASSSSEEPQKNLVIPLESAILLPLAEGGDVHPGITHLLTTNPSLSGVISRHPCTLFSPSGLLEPVDPFHSLCSGIISQQVSSAAATSIKSRFISLFNDQKTFPTPQEILTKDIPTLRTAGLSQRKAEYISGLASLFSTGELTNSLLLESSDEVVTEKLIKVRGLGLWSIQMFLLFALKRTDVFATGDLGIQRGMAVLAGKDVNKLKFSKPGKGGKWKYMAEEEMVRLAEGYRPYRSLLSWYLWRLADTDVEVLKAK